jgi:acetylornithine deacetylase/succinyl-diaminopimelate desuccinylase-like protein
MSFDPVEKLKEFIRCPSVSADPAFHGGMAQARDFVAGLLEGMGFSVEVVATPRHPIIFAKRGDNPAWPGVIIYGHYDVQPPDPLDLWTTPAFEPEVRGGRLYGRGAADNKGPLMAHIVGVSRLLEAEPDLPLRITFMIEGEEEIGSPNLLPFVQARREELLNAGDLVLLSDTGSPSPEQIVVTTGLRGIVTMEIEVTGPKRDLHSGLHGGPILNPIQGLAEILASLHTPDGRVAIPGFYDDVVDGEPWEREQLARLGTDEADYLEFLGSPQFHCPPGYNPFEAIRFQPTLEFNGIGGGYQGVGSKTVIPARAMAKISCRLVANQDPQRIEQLVMATLRERCPKGVRLEIRPGHTGRPYLVVPPGRSNTPADQPPALARAFRGAEQAIAAAFGKPPLFLREGGSVPIISDIKRALGLDSLMIGLFLPEDNLHAPDESFHLGVFEKGIQASMGVLRSLANR